jgi:hypothetical protein
MTARFATAEEALRFAGSYQNRPGLPAVEVFEEDEKFGCTRTWGIQEIKNMNEKEQIIAALTDKNVGRYEKNGIVICMTGDGDAPGDYGIWTNEHLWASGDLEEMVERFLRLTNF